MRKWLHTFKGLKMKILSLNFSPLSHHSSASGVNIFPAALVTKAAVCGDVPFCSWGLSPVVLTQMCITCCPGRGTAPCTFEVQSQVDWNICCSFQPVLYSLFFRDLFKGTNHFLMISIHSKLPGSIWQCPSPDSRFVSPAPSPSCVPVNVLRWDNRMRRTWQKQFISLRIPQVGSSLYK